MARRKRRRMVPKKPAPLVIAIDFQGTFSEAPELWTQIIRLMQAAGHTVICITAGGLVDPVTKTPTDFMGIERIVDHFILSHMQWKKWAAMDHGYNVDIWIEDMPEFVSPLAISEYLKGRQ